MFYTVEYIHLVTSGGVSRIRDLGALGIVLQWAGCGVVCEIGYMIYTNKIHRREFQWLCGCGHRSKAIAAGMISIVNHISSLN